MRCSYCHQQGHNRTTCPTLKEYCEKHPDSWTARKEKNRAEKKKAQLATRGPRLCGFCKEAGHTRRKCVKAAWTRHRLKAYWKAAWSSMVAEWGGIGWGTLLRWDTDHPTEYKQASLHIVTGKAPRLRISTDGRFTVGYGTFTYSRYANQWRSGAISLSPKDVRVDKYGGEKGWSVIGDTTAPETSVLGEVAEGEFERLIQLHLDEDFKHSQWMSTYYGLFHSDSSGNPVNVGDDKELLKELPVGTRAAFQ